MSHMETTVVLADVRDERSRQDEKWGQQDHDPYGWLAILGEEFGEVARAILESYHGGKDLEAYRKELIQVAAVAVAAVECLDRGEWRKYK